MDLPPKVSLIIPFYNDQDRLLERLKEVCAYFNKQDYPSEVILVDDGSQRNRNNEIKEKFPRVHIIRYEKNRGKGFAVRTGMLEAKGRFRFFTDADIPFGMEPLTTGLKYMELKEYDLVIGDRQAPGSVYSIHQTLWRRIASRLFTSFISRIVITGVKDTQCGFKGFRARIAENIFKRSRINGFAFDVEVVYIAYKHHYDLKRIPVKLEYVGKSTLSMPRHSWEMFLDVFKIKWNHIRAYYR